MARSVFPDDRLAFRFAGRLIYSGSGARMVVYLDEAATVLAPITTYPADTPIAGSVIYVGADSLLPEFYGPDGVLALWLLAEGAAQTYPVEARLVDRVEATIPYVWSYSGTQLVRSGVMRLYLDGDYEYVGAVAGMAAPPLGAALLVDVNLDGTTIFGNQASRLAVPAGAHTGTAGTPTVTDLDQGGYVTVDVDQVGSGDPGDDLSVVLSLRRKG